MGKAIEGVNWEEVQLAYQKGENCRQIGERLGISIKAISQRCTKEGWRKEQKVLGELVSKITIQSLAERRVKRIEEHQELVIPIATSLIKSVGKSHDSMPEGLMDPAMIQGLATGLKTAVGVCRQALGAVDPQQIDITSGGHELGHASALAMLASCKALHSQGKLREDIDVEELVKQHAEQKKLEG